jgi:hypothetical protein
MPTPDFHIKTGDSSSDIYATLENSGGTPVNIQAATVAFKMASIAGGTTVIAAAAINAQVGAGTADGSLGDVIFSWGGTNVVPSNPGLYVAEWEVVFTNGSVQTFPNDGYSLILVTSDL